MTSTKLKRTSQSNKSRYPSFPPSNRLPKCQILLSQFASQSKAPASRKRAHALRTKSSSWPRKSRLSSSSERSSKRKKRSSRRTCAWRNSLSPLSRVRSENSKSLMPCFNRTSRAKNVTWSFNSTTIRKTWSNLARCISHKVLRRKFSSKRTSCYKKSSIERLRSCRTLRSS